MKVLLPGLKYLPPALRIKKDAIQCKPPMFGHRSLGSISLISSLGVLTLMTLHLFKEFNRFTNSLKTSDATLISRELDALPQEKKLVREAENETVATLFELYRDAVEPFVYKIHGMLKLFEHTSPELTDLFNQEIESLTKAKTDNLKNNVSPELIRKLGINSPLSAQVESAKTYFEAIRMTLLQAYYMIDSEITQGEQNVPYPIRAAIEEFDAMQIKPQDKLYEAREKLKSAMQANGNKFENIWDLGDLVTDSSSLKKVF